MATQALATIEKKTRRVPGKAIETNPLAAIVVQATAEQVRDLDKEIEATTNYLSGLKRVREVFGHVLNEDEPLPTEAVEVKQLEAPKPHPRAAGGVTKAAGRPKLKSGSPPGRKPTGCSLKIQEIFEANIDTPVPEVVTQLRAAGFNNPEASMTSLIYVVRGRIRDKKGPGAAPAAPRNSVKAAMGGTVGQTQQKPAAPKPEPPKEKTPHLGGLVDDKVLRETVAEFVFKKGLVSIGDIIQNCGLAHEAANEFMQHPWFERHMDKWRLTKVGKAEGVSY